MGAMFIPDDVEIFVEELPQDAVHLPATADPHRVRHVGWLGHQQPYPIGDVGDNVLERLKRLTLACECCVTRGYYQCPFFKDCEEGKDPAWIPNFTVDSQRMLMGSAEVWIPDQTNNLIYRCPNLLVHYIERHGYRPPQDFLDLVCALIS
jgi:hypothetical protein